MSRRAKSMSWVRVQTRPFSAGASLESACSRSWALEVWKTRGSRIWALICSTRRRRQSCNESKSLRRRASERSHLRWRSWSHLTLTECSRKRISKVVWVCRAPHVSKTYFSTMWHAVWLTFSVRGSRLGCSLAIKAKQPKWLESNVDSSQRNRANRSLWHRATSIWMASKSIQKRSIRWSDTLLASISGRMKSY